MLLSNYYCTIIFLIFFLTVTSNLITMKGTNIDKEIKSFS